MLPVQISMSNFWKSRSWLSITDSQLLTAYRWLSTIDGQVMIDLDHQELTAQILMEWYIDGLLLLVNYW